MDRQALVFDQEIYNQFKYKSPRPYFHTFEGDDAQIGLNFADEGEADIFRQTVGPHNFSSQASNFHHRLSRSCWKENKEERRDRRTKSSSSKVLSFVIFSSISDIVLRSKVLSFVTFSSISDIILCSMVFFPSPVWLRCIFHTNLTSGNNSSVPPPQSLNGLGGGSTLQSNIPKSKDQSRLNKAGKKRLHHL